MENAMKAKIFTQTTLAPAGVSSSYDATSPPKKQTTDRIDEHIMTDLKLLDNLIDVKAGNMTRLEISSVPIIRIPRTMVTAVKKAIKREDV